MDLLTVRNCYKRHTNSSKVDLLGAREEEIFRLNTINRLAFFLRVGADPPKLLWNARTYHHQ